MSRQDTTALIVQRAWKDEAFRTEFLGDPKATIEKYSRQKLPADVKIVALAKNDRTIHFLIPSKPTNADELTDTDLEKVAGGRWHRSDYRLGSDFRGRCDYHGG